MVIDHERAAVYAAELAAFDGTDLESVIALDDVDAAVSAVVTGPWWTGPHVVLRRARSDARSSSTRCGPAGDPATITIAADQTTIATAAHELAHVLAGPVAGHNGSFRAAYLDVIAAITNRDSVGRRMDIHIRQLATAFSDAGLSVGPRGWHPPPTSMAGPIAL